MIAGLVVFELAVFEFDQSIGEVEIVVVVGNGDDRFTLALEVGEKFGVEVLPEAGVLVGGPFVE